MDRIRFGRSIHALRVRRGWRQQDLADATGLSVSAISRIEQGRIRGVPWSRLERVAEALDATIGLDLRWRGGDLDRLLDAAHAAVVEALARLYRSAGWEVVIEATFSEYGERGSIDLFAWHPTTGYVAVNEVKASIADAGRTVTGVDRKARLAPIVAKKLGWRCQGVARFLVVADTSTARRRIREHEATFQAAFPIRGPAGRRWIAGPTGRPVAALMYLSASHRVGVGPGISRVGRVRRRGRAGRKWPDPPDSHAMRAWQGRGGLLPLGGNLTGRRPICRDNSHHVGIRR